MLVLRKCWQTHRFIFVITVVITDKANNYIHRCVQFDTVVNLIEILSNGKTRHIS